jgi:peroxiredoxin (alkyl hydroperoxide reductase subunit C)
LPEFEKRNTIVIGASCDTDEVHFAWLNTAKNNGGIRVTYLSLLTLTEIYQTS